MVAGWRGGGTNWVPVGAIFRPGLKRSSWVSPALFNKTYVLKKGLEKGFFLGPKILPLYFILLEPSFLYLIFPLKNFGCFIFLPFGGVFFFFYFGGLKI